MELSRCLIPLSPSVVLRSTNQAPLPQYPYLFLSVSIEAKPASCIGTFGLSLTCLLAPFLAFIRYSYVRKHLEENLEKGEVFDKVKLWNRRAMYLAIYTGIGGHGVASFQSAVDDCGGAPWIVGVHLIFACMFFSGGSCYCFVSHWLDQKLPNLGTERERLYRKIFCYGTILQFVTVCCVFPALWALLGAPDYLIALMSFLEVTMLGTFMSTYITFMDEFKQAFEASQSARWCS